MNGSARGLIRAYILGLMIVAACALAGALAPTTSCEDCVFVNTVQLDPTQLVDLR